MPHELGSAIRSGDVQQIVTWIASGSIDVNVRITTTSGNQSTPLMIAAEHDQKEIVELLLNAGARLDDVDDYLQTACHSAIRLGHIDVMRVLMARGASVAMRDVHGFSALFGVLLLDSPDLAIELLDAGAPLDRDHSAELCHAASMDVRLTRVLLDRRIVLSHFACSDGCTPCHRAVWRGQDDGALMRMLVDEAGVDPDALDSDGRTCALLCALRDETKSLRQLIAAGADIERADRDLQTPLHHACRHNHAHAVFLLLAAGASVHAVNNHLRTPAHFAAELDSFYPVAFKTEIVVALLAVGADFDACDHRNDTPRQLAANWGFVPPSENDLVVARKQIASIQLGFVRERALQVCVGLQERNLDALQMCEVLKYACGPIASVIPFHVWWKIATIVKHFRKCSS